MTKSVRAVCFIFARGGSKGLPGKNIKHLAGKPLIGYAISVARTCAQIETVIVSTDDPAIADEARREGAEVPFEFMTPDSGLAWKCGNCATEHLHPSAGVCATSGCNREDLHEVGERP